MHSILAAAALRAVGLAALAAVPLVAPAIAAPVAIEGTWIGQSYTPKSGKTFEMKGAFIFQKENWSLTYLVVNDGDVQRGFAQTGRFTRSGDALSLTGNVAIYTYAPAIEGLWEQPARTIVFPPEGGKPVSARVALAGDTLTVTFGSGSVMVFRRR